MLKAILVDDDELARDYIKYLAESVEDLEIVSDFEDPEKAISFMECNEVDLALLDVGMPKMNGIELGYRLQKLNSKLMLIYLTATETHAMDALKLKAAAYLLKPVKKDEFLYAVDSARLLAKRHSKRIFVRTFGYFDLFVDGKPVMFKSAKAKELLALLIDRRGGTINTDQIINVLWEERPNDDSTQNLCSKIVKTLKRELDEHGIGDILLQQRGVRSIDTDKIECDLFDYLNGKATKQNSFLGDYMLDYSWAEEKIPMLWSRKEM